MALIYCVEDDKNIRELLVYALNNNGFKAIGFGDGESFFKDLKRLSPSLILLDIMLPDTDGLEILKNLRENQNTKDIPIIMITAKSSEYDRVIGLDLGADDYIVKPFGIMEIISRINALLRRIDRNTDKDIDKKGLKFKGIYLDYEKRIVKVGDSFITLTYKEFELLYYLLQNKNIVLSRDSILNAVWGYEYMGETRTVDVHIRSLRMKLKEDGAFIQTIRNVGYKIGDIDAEKDI